MRVVRHPRGPLARGFCSPPVLWRIESQAGVGLRTLSEEMGIPKKSLGSPQNTQNNTLSGFFPF